MSEVAIPIDTEEGRTRIRANEVHRRSYELVSGEFVHVQVEQLGIDVLLRLFDPGGEPLAEVDSPTGASGYEELVWIAEQPGEHRLEVVAPAGDADGAFVYTTVARRPATSSDRDFVAAAELLRHGLGRVGEGRWQEAIAPLRRGLATWIEQGQTRREADTLYALGRSYQGLGHDELAMAFFKRALERYRQSGEELLVAVTASRLGALRQAGGQVERAIADFEEAQTLFRRLGYERGVGLTASRLGTAYYLLGDLRQSLLAFEEAVSRLEEHRASDQELASVLIHSGTVYLALNRPREAEQQFARAEQLYRRQDDAPGRARALVRTANAAFRLGETARAGRLVETAIELLRDAARVSDPEARRELAVAQVLLARKQKGAGRLAAAETQLSETLELAVEIGDRQLEGALLLELGHVRSLDDDAAGALERLGQAREALVAAGDRTGEAMARVRAAQALGALGRHGEALERLEPALALAEHLRVASDRLDIRTDYFAFRQEFFEVAIELAMQQHALEPGAGHDLRALEIHERRRSRVLLDTLAERPASLRRQAPPELLAREATLEDELRRWTWSEADVSEGRIPSLLAELEQVRAEIRTHARRADWPATTDPPSLAAVREEILDRETLALVYALGSARSYLWVVTAGEIEAFELPPRAAIEDLARGFVDRLPTLAELSIAHRQRIGRQLSELLLGPVASRLRGQRLVVVPMGTLQLLAFSALPFPGADDPEDYLVRHHALTIVPSLTILARLRRVQERRRPEGRGIAIFADPVFGPDDERVLASVDIDRPHHERSARSPSESPAESQTELQTESPGSEHRALERLADVFGFGFERLVYSGIEAESLAAMTGGATPFVATGFEANRETFLRRTMAGYRSLHFATHAFQHLDHPELSSLVLSLVDESGQRREGLLSVYEIARLELAAEMVVLSACRTGLGKQAAGEGVLGLSRAFFDAGATRVVSSLWPVADRSTAQLMIDFYDAYLRQDLDPATALQGAQLAMLERSETTHPYHWAGFVFQGDWHESKTTPGSTGARKETDMSQRGQAEPDVVDPGTDPIPTPHEDGDDELTEAQRRELEQIEEEELKRLREEV